MYGWPGFRRITGRVNAVTGEMIDLDPPVELHGEDADWWYDSWAEIDLLEYKIRVAKRMSEEGIR